MTQAELFPRRARKGDPWTSHAARRGPSMTDQILVCFDRAGALTDDELAALLHDYPAPSVKTARSRLALAGKLVNTGMVRPSRLGRPMNVWRRPDGARPTVTERAL